MTIIHEMQFSLRVAMRKICKGLVTVPPSFPLMRHLPRPLNILVTRKHSWSSVAVCTSHSLCRLGKIAQWLLLYLCISHENTHIGVFPCLSSGLSITDVQGADSVHGSRQEDTGNLPECGGLWSPGSYENSNPRRRCQTTRNKWLPPILHGASSQPSF